MHAVGDVVPDASESSEESVAGVEPSGVDDFGVVWVSRSRKDGGGFQERDRDAADEVAEEEERVKGEERSTSNF